MERELLERVSRGMEMSRCRESVTVSVAAADSEVLCVLEVGGVLTTGVALRRNRDAWYVSMADSTGHKRGYNREFITAVLAALDGLVVCFSQPKAELIFGGSSRNTEKRVLSPRALFRLWESCFQHRCVRCTHHSADPPAVLPQGCHYCTWSNFDSHRGCPYGSIREIAIFEDDPKSRMRRKFRRVTDLFAGLLHRRDFATGGLLFSRCVCRDWHEAAQQCRAVQDGTAVHRVLRFLRTADFSTEQSTAAATAEMRAQHPLASLTLTPNGNGLPLPATPVTAVRVTPRPAH